MQESDLRDSQRTALLVIRLMGLKSHLLWRCEEPSQSCSEQATIEQCEPSRLGSAQGDLRAHCWQTAMCKACCTGTLSFALHHGACILLFHHCRPDTGGSPCWDQLVRPMDLPSLTQ
jgi:hypothetical protein